MARRAIPDSDGTAALHAVTAGSPTRDQTAMAVRWTLQRLAEDAPGNTVEVRIPPFGAVQCVEGPRHTRGTPPNVVETDADTWISLWTGTTTWAEAMTTGRVHASGQRADLTEYLPGDSAHRA